MALSVTSLPSASSTVIMTPALRDRGGTPPLYQQGSKVGT